MVLLLVAIVVAGGCSRDPLGSDAGRVLAGSSLEVAVDDGWEAAEVGDPLADGARVRTGETEARLELRDGEAWLAPGSIAVVNREAVDAIRGDVLVVSGGQLAARWGDAEVAGEGAFRLTPGVTPLLRVYRGAADVHRPGEERQVEARRELSLATTRLAVKGAPLSYDPDDAWDRQLLPKAVAFDDEVARLARGIDRQHGTAPQAPEFYETFSAVAQETIPLLISVSRRVLADERFGPPSDALITLFVAEAAAGPGPLSLTEAAREVTRWRQRGARWGLVALELDITTSELARVVDLGQERRTAAEEELPPATAPADDSSVPREGVPSRRVVPTEGEATASTSAPAPAGTSTTPPRSSSPPSSSSPPPPPPPSSPPPPPSSSPDPDPVPDPDPTQPAPEVPLPSPSSPPPTLSSPVDAATKVVEDLVEGTEDTTGSLLGD